MSVPQENKEVEIEFEFTANYKTTNDLDHKHLTKPDFSIEKPKELIETEDGNFKIPFTITLKKPIRKPLVESQESHFTSKIQREYGDINLKTRMHSNTRHVDFNSDAEWISLPNGPSSKETVTSVISHLSRTHSDVSSIITIKPSCFRNFESTMDTSMNYFTPQIETEGDLRSAKSKPKVAVKFNYKLPLGSKSDSDLKLLYSRNVLPYAYDYETVLERINNLLEIRLKPFQDSINETKQAVFEILANSKKV